jgi:hypothetical protein
MKHLSIALFATLCATPLMAEPACAPATDPAPVWQAIQSFEAEGGTIIAFKINGGGCYEIYGKLNGKKMEVFFDPNTGKELGRL